MTGAPQLAASSWMTRVTAVASRLADASFLPTRKQHLIATKHSGPSQPSVVALPPGGLREVDCEFRHDASSRDCFLYLSDCCHRDRARVVPGDGAPVCALVRKRHQHRANLAHGLLPAFVVPTLPVFAPPETSPRPGPSAAHFRPACTSDASQPCRYPISPCPDGRSKTSREGLRR